MIVFPNAKINLGLNITAKREDGYHDISSCFIPIGWKDALEAIPADEFGFSSSGLAIPGDTSQNLCVKAYALLQENHDIAPVKMHLHKVIPMGAGLGGGSADGAFALKLLNELCALNLSDTQLEAYAKTLGADCPFFIQNTPRLVSGIGDIFEETAVDLTGYLLVVVYPNVHVNTGMAFSKMTPQKPELVINRIIDKEIVTWQKYLVNDFEKPVFEMHPEIAEIKMKLLTQGASYASMSGSGSSVYGIFKEGIQPDEEKLAGNYLRWSGPLGF